MKSYKNSMKPKIHIKSVVLYGNSGEALATYKDEDIICEFEYNDDGSTENLKFLSSTFSVPKEIPNHARFVAEASITKLVREKLYHA